MIKRKSAAGLLDVLQDIEKAIARYYAGAEPDEVIEQLDEKVSLLRDVIWHEMPEEFALRMDEEDGVTAFLEALKNK